jgi:hypothetical protein
MPSENNRFNWYQIEHALLDPKTYILVVLSFSAQIPNGLLTSFKSQVHISFLNLLNLSPNAARLSKIWDSMSYKRHSLESQLTSSKASRFSWLVISLPAFGVAASSS